MKMFYGVGALVALVFAVMAAGMAIRVMALDAYLWAGGLIGLAVIALGLALVALTALRES